MDHDDNIFKSCHHLCKTCSGEGNDDNNHCIECNDEEREEVNGNCICKHYFNYEKTGCITTIDPGYYNNNPTDRTIDKCPIKCSTCSYESIVTNHDLCVTCNINDGYYPKSNAPGYSNSYYDCYQEEQIGYYLDNENNVFKPCHSLCKKCSGDGDDENNHCLECIEDDNNYILTDGNCINENNNEFKYSYNVDSPSEERKNDYTHTFIDMNEETISHLKSVFSIDERTKIYIRIVENDSSNLATADYTYEYILDNGTKLEVDDIEEDIYFDVYVPLKDLDAVNFELAKKYAGEGYDIYT